MGYHTDSWTWCTDHAPRPEFREPLVSGKGQAELSTPFGIFAQNIREAGDGIDNVMDGYYDWYRIRLFYIAMSLLILDQWREAEELMYNELLELYETVGER